MEVKCYQEMIKEEDTIILNNVGFETYNKIMDILELTYKESFTKTFEELVEMRILLSDYAIRYGDTHSKVYLGFVIHNQRSNIAFTLTELARIKREGR